MSHGVRVAFLALLFTALAALTGCGQPTRFDPAAFNDQAAIQKNADAYWKRDGWWGGMKGVNKVAITQFNVEFVTQNTNKSGASALSVIGLLEMGGMGKRQRAFDESFKQDLPNYLYDGLVEAIRGAGYEVVPMETITSHPAFAQLKAAAAGQSRSESGRNILGGADRSTSAKIQTYPVKGLPLPDDGFFNFGAADNMKAEWRMVGDSGAQAAVRVRIRVGLDDDGRAIIGGGSTILTMYEPEKVRGLSGDEWYFKQRGQVIGGPELRDDVPVVDAKEFKAFQGDVYTVNSEKFRQSISKMYPAYVRMAMVKLKG